MKWKSYFFAAPKDISRFGKVWYHGGLFTRSRSTQYGEGIVEAWVEEAMDQMIEAIEKGPLVIK